MNRRDYKLLRIGMLMEDLSKDGCVIHNWPPFEINTVHGHYLNMKSQGENTELEELILHGFAECVSDLLFLGHEEYKKQLNAGRRYRE